MNLCDCGRYYEGDYSACAYCRPAMRQRELSTPKRAEWLAKANCRDMDTNLFFDTDRRTKEDTERKLRMVCMACEVRRQCADDVFHWESFHGDMMRVGFQAGMTAEERKEVARRRPKGRAGEVFAALKDAM